MPWLKARRELKAVGEHGVNPIWETLDHAPKKIRGQARRGPAVQLRDGERGHF
jgi:hypothetical protein